MTNGVTEEKPVRVGSEISKILNVVHEALSPCFRRMDEWREQSIIVSSLDFFCIYSLFYHHFLLEPRSEADIPLIEWNVTTWKLLPVCVVMMMTLYTCSIIFKRGSTPTRMDANHSTTTKGRYGRCRPWNNGRSWGTTIYESILDVCIHEQKPWIICMIDNMYSSRILGNPFEFINTTAINDEFWEWIHI